VVVQTVGSQSLLPIALPERPSARAFTIQYTTLILIIISFIVGAFGGKPTEREVSAHIEQNTVNTVETPTTKGEGGAVPQHEGRNPTDSIRIEHLFMPASVELDSAKASAIATVLKSHDIDAEIDIVADSMGDDDYKIALRQARSLMRFLTAASVPAHAFRVFVVESKIPEWAALETESVTTVRLYRGGSDGDS